MYKFNKKAIDMKLGALILLVFALIIVFIPIPNISELVQGSIYQSTLKECEIQEGIIEGDEYCNPVNCDTEDCSDSQESRWDNLVSGFEETKCYEDEDECETRFEQRMHVLVHEEELEEFEMPRELLDYGARNPEVIQSTISSLEELGINGVSAHQYLIQLAEENNVDEDLALLVITRESRGDPNAISPTGAAGIAQFTSSTARDFDEIFNQITPCCSEEEARLGECASSPSCNPNNDDRFDVEKSLKAGVEYLARHSQRYEDNVILILTAYNAGQSVADQCQEIDERNELLECVYEKTHNEHGSAKVREISGYLSEIVANYEAEQEGIIS